MGIYITFDGGSGTGKGMLISWLERYLLRKGKRVKVLRDNEIAPLRDHGALMLQWCQENNIDKAVFVFPLFVAGFKITDKVIEAELENYDFVLRDRSFVSSLAYRAAPGDLTQEQIWNLFVDHVKLHVPDVAAIVDSDVDVAMEREALRKQIDKGLGGKMSGSRENRVKIREYFLKLPEIFGDRMGIIVLQNNGKFTADQRVVARRIAVLGKKLLRFMSEKGVKV